MRDETVLTMTRRGMMLAAAAGVVPTGLRAEERIKMHVVEGLGCECCKQWTAYLKNNGFDVTSEERFGTLLMQHKIDLGVPNALTSCHTGTAGGYFFEGHVPAADIRKVLADQPDARGLTVPGMPFGSPGMGPEDRRDAYDVLLVRMDGTSDVFTRYPAAQ